MARPTLHAVLGLFEGQVSDNTREWLERACTNKELTRDAFFEAAYWAILVANMNVATAQQWENKASACGFPFSWRELGDWNDDDGKFDGWCKKMARELVAPKDDLDGVFRERWRGIWNVGWRLAQFEGDAAFRKAYFDGKKNGAELTDEDFHRLQRIKARSRRRTAGRGVGALYRIGDVSIYFILRNLGGNFLKPDTWIIAFADWFGRYNVSQLALALQADDIHCGRFDAYCWEYCSSHLGRASDLPEHFNGLFP